VVADGGEDDRGYNAGAQVGDDTTRVADIVVRVSLPDRVPEVSQGGRRRLAAGAIRMRITR
jgi:hypothetical protein